MTRTTIIYFAWPVGGLSVLLMAACLASIAYIGRLQSDLGESLRADAARLQAAQQAQIHLREYRVHTVVLAASPNADRRRQVDYDRDRLSEALAALEHTADAEDRADLGDLMEGWRRYQGGLSGEDKHTDKGKGQAPQPYHYIS